jgi:signal transduction histidine kinase
VTLTVADDGAGFDPDGDFPGHLGLRSMRERADRAAATLSIESAPGAGTTLTLTMPVSPA